MTVSTVPSLTRGRVLRSTEDTGEWGASSGPWRASPSLVLLPADVEEVARTLVWSAEHGVALIPRGAGTGMPAGNVGPWAVLALTGSGFSWSEPPDPEACTIRVGAATTAADVQSAAAAVGLEFPPLPSSARWATVGGMIAAGAAGARSFGLGVVADWVEAVDLLRADGRPLRLARGVPCPDPTLVASAGASVERWPRVRKNASGYALDRVARSGDVLDVVCGSEGTLGVVTSATLRLRRPPPARRLGVLAAPRRDVLLAWAAWARDTAAHPAGSRVTACEFIGPWLVERAALDRDPRVGRLVRPGGALVLLEWEGSTDGVTALQGRLRSGARDLGLPDPVVEASKGSALWTLRRRASPVIARAAAEGRRSMQFIEDAVVPPDRLEDYLDGLDRILADAETEAARFGHAGDANVHVNPLVDVTRPDWRARVAGMLAQTAALVAELGGTLSGEHGDGRVRAPYLEEIWGSGHVATFRALKEAWDPDGRLNPGVILPLPGQDPLAFLSDAPSRVLHD